MRRVFNMEGWKVFMTDCFWPDIEVEKNILKEIGAELALSSTNDFTDVETVKKEGKDCDALMVLFTPMNKEVLSAFPNCKLLVRMGIGYDSVDMEYATEKGIMVANVPDYCQEEVADHTITLFLTGIRKIIMLHEEVKQGGWDMRIADPIPRLQGKVYGVWGCGGIGQKVAKRAQSFGMKVFGYDPYCPEEKLEGTGIKKIDNLDDFLSMVDFVSLHIPHTPETEKIVNMENLKKMKTSAYLINTSRGTLVNEEDLYTALEKGVIAGAALDVLDPDPPVEKVKLASLENVLITPHAAWNSEDAIPELRRKAAEEVVRTYRDGKPKALINKKVME